MAAIAPFRALRPASSAAPDVAAVPYDVVSTEEARALASENPLSFLHVSRAEIDLPPGTSPFADQVYTTARHNFDRLKREAPLFVEDVPRLYMYRLRMGTHIQTGVAACFSVDDYENGTIRKHECTRPDKEDDRTRHLLELGAQTGPVFLTYREEPALTVAMERVVSSAPIYDFIADDGIHHTLWVCGSEDGERVVTGFQNVPALYIADGHHRAASAARARERRAGAAGNRGEWDWFLAVAFPDAQVQILPYNRVVRDLAGMTPADLMEVLRRQFSVTPGPAVPTHPGEVAMFLNGAWYTIVLGDGHSGPRTADQLDVMRLQQTILAPLLKIGDVRTDKRIDFVGGARGTGELEARVRSGADAIAFSLFPVELRDLMAISDEGAIMPPKSTWFEPKLRDGLLSHLI